jgi:hypothetical protein
MRLTPVQRAARMMDRAKPNWYKRIVLKRLNLARHSDCVCGQAGLDWVELAAEYDRRYDRRYGDAEPFADADLRDEWIAEIRKRRTAAA